MVFYPMQTGTTPFERFTVKLSGVSNIVNRLTKSLSLIKGNSEKEYENFSQQVVNLANHIGEQGEGKEALEEFKQLGKDDNVLTVTKSKPKKDLQLSLARILPFLEKTQEKDWATKQLEEIQTGIKNTVKNAKTLIPIINKTLGSDKQELMNLVSKMST